MHSVTACIARFSLVLALMFGPVLHESAICEMSIADTHAAMHANDHAEPGPVHDHGVHDHGHGAPADHHANGCCDTVCSMACTAILTTVMAPQEPSVVDTRLVELTTLHVGSSTRPDPHPPKSFAPIVSA